ncbi:hypothetical protein [Paenibacillus lautus]|uniref:hypothetical protein n=1 Tax=Paenibacillus lautus TaxID=1401 RepID=UPI003D28B344
MMSTKFRVCRTISYFLPISELVALANEERHSFLNAFELNIAPIIGARIGKTLIEVRLQVR